MKRPFTQLEKKQLLIFTLIAFGIPYLMGIAFPDIGARTSLVFCNARYRISCRNHCRLSSQ